MSRPAVIGSGTSLPAFESMVSERSLNYLIASRRPPGRAVWQWSLDVWMADRQRQTDRQTDKSNQIRPNIAQHRPPKSTPNRPQIDPTSTPNRSQIDPKSKKVPRCTRKRSKKRKNTIYQMVALAFCRFRPILGRSWAPLDFDLGPKIVPKSLRRDLFGFLRSPRAPFVHFQVNIKSKTTFDRC